MICAPQQYVGEELNFDGLIIAASEGTDVLCPADGVVLNFGVGYEKSLHESVSFHAGSDNFDSILGELEEAGELKDLPVPTRYVGGDIFMRLEDGRMIFISGLTGGIPMKTGMRVSKGEVIGRVGYAYHKIGRPHIILSVTGSTGRPDDYARIMLPNSKIMVQIPVVKCVLDETVTGRYPAGRGLLPDYEVPLTYVEVYTSPTDPVLSKALSLIARQSSRTGN